MLPNVEVVHIHEGNGIAILIVIEQHADFIKQQLYVEARRVFVRFVVHFDLSRP